MLKTKDRVNLGLHLMARYDLYSHMDLVAIGETFVLDNKFDYLQQLLGKRSSAKHDLRRKCLKELIGKLADIEKHTKACE